MNRESERQRLVEMADSFLQEELGANLNKDILGEFAKHLLDKGAMVPPYPIGERVFVVITNKPFVQDDVYECKIKAWMSYEDGSRPLIEIAEEGTFKGLAVNVNDTDLFTSMAAAQTILGLKKKKSEKMLKGEGK